MGTLGVFKLPDLFASMPEWFSQAACRSTSPDVFFPAGYDWKSVAEAKAICADCPILYSCRRWALDTWQKHGVWGGTTPSERVAIKRRERHGR